MKFTAKYIALSAVIIAIGSVAILIYRKSRRDDESLAETIADAASGVKQKVQSWIVPVKARITSPFTESRLHPTSKTWKAHRAIDLAVPVGTPVKSPMNGKVEKVFNRKGGGKQMIVLHDNGYRTGYAHLSAFKVSQDERVKAGQIIALSGNTGTDSSGPHLHLSLTDPQGKKVDPQQVIYKV